MYLVHKLNEALSDGAANTADVAVVDDAGALHAAAADVPVAEILDELVEHRRRFQLARVLKVTGQMMEHANAGEWQQVEELELLRRVELEECFSLQGGQPSPLVAEAMATLMYLNEQLVQLVRYARGRLSASHESDSRAFTAVRAYEDMR